MRHPLFTLLGFQLVSAARLARRRRPGKSASSVEDLENRQLLAADVRLIKDISPGATSSKPSQLTDVGGTLFFTAEQTPGDVELWTSDGTPNGTRVVKDILPGPDGASPRELTNVNGILYFSARSVINTGFELWRSDGTESGTFMVQDIVPGGAGAQLSELTDVNGTLFFSATDGAHGFELWKSDGTAAGTVIVKDIVPGSGDGLPRHLTNIAGILYFSANDGVHGKEVWKSDGTEGGTSMVQDSVPGIQGSNPAYFTDVNGAAYYLSFSNPNQGLWKSDGTDAGTGLIRYFFRGDSFSLAPDLTNVNGTLYFVRDNGTIWKSDGTPGGTQVVTQGRNLHEYNGKLMFKDAGDLHWATTDGTAMGTTTVTTLSNYDQLSVVHDGRFYMTRTITPPGGGNVFGYEFWSFDGTNLNLEHEFVVGVPAVDLFEFNFLSIGASLYFRGGTSNAGAFGNELWAFNQIMAPAVQVPATFTTSNHPTITWSVVPGAVSYEIRLNDLTNGVDDFVRQTLAGTSFTPSVDFGLGSFSILIQATVAGGRKSGWSQSYQFRNYLRVIPQTIQRLQGTSRPTIAWNALQGSAKYDLWVDNITTGQSQVIRNTNLTTTSFTPAADLPMGVYRAWVRGMTADGITGYFSMPIDFVVVPTPTVIGPLNSTFSRQPAFSWSAVTGAVGYELVLRNANNGQVVHSVTISSGTSWTPPADLPVGTYRWQVVAVSSDGYRSQAPQVITFFVGGRTDVLSPTGTTSDRTPTFSWRPVDGAAAYRIKVDRLNVSVNGIIDVTSLVATLHYTPTTPLPVGTYRVWVRAIDTFGELGLWSLPVNFQVTQASESVDDFLVAILPTEVVVSVLSEERKEFSLARKETPLSHDTVSDQSANAPAAEDEFVLRQSESPHSIPAQSNEDHAERDREGILDRLMAGQGEADDLAWMF